MNKKKQDYEKKEEEKYKKHLDYEKAKGRYFEEMAKKAEEKQEKITTVLVN